MNKTVSDEAQLQQALRDFEGQALAYANNFIKDARVRAWYIDEAKKARRAAESLYKTGGVTALQAAEVANGLRNEALDIARARTSAVSKSAAILLKERGLALETLVAKYADSMFKKGVAQLTQAERQVVCLRIVEASATTNPGVNSAMRSVGVAGRTFWIFTAVIAFYNVGMAENKPVAAGREASNIAGGLLGSMATGAAVGAAMTGPLAVFGAALGAVVGGIVGAALADDVYVANVVPMSEPVARLVPRFAHTLWRDEEGLAHALYAECGTRMDDVCAVVKFLNENYTSDADDVVCCYLELVRRYRGAVEQALKAHARARTLLVDTLDSGWTDAAERRAIAYVQGLG